MHYIILSALIMASLAGIIYNVFRHKDEINVMYGTIWGSVFIFSLAGMINKMNDDIDIMSYVFAVCIEAAILYMAVIIKRKRNRIPDK